MVTCDLLFISDHAHGGMIKGYTCLCHSRKQKSEYFLLRNSLISGFRNAYGISVHLACE